MYENLVTTNTYAKMKGVTTMNRKEYEDRLAEKEKEIDKIEAEISALKEKYCNDCSPFKVGDKIRFKGKDGNLSNKKNYSLV